MQENYRDSFANRNPSDDREETGQRWRRAEGRYRREALGGEAGTDPRYNDDRWDRNSEAGYGRSGRETEYGGRGGLGRNADWREDRGYDQRTYYGARDYDSSGYAARPSGGRDDNRPVHHWHAEDRERRAGHPYEGTYGGTGNSSYFTGSQGSWAVGAPQTPSAYYGGGRNFGADYRSHGYGSRDDSHDRGFWDRASDEVASWFGDEDAARRREQDHRGRGPSDYTRSDERIKEDANDRLTEDWRLDASNITVTVEQGEISLNGTVTSREAKRRAEDVVDDISGVKHVQNNLRVQAVSASAYRADRPSGASAALEGGTLSSPRGDETKQTGKL
jgi:osmotically-inducible protein OsmY